VDRDARGRWNAGIGDGWQRIEMSGGRRLRRPRPKLGSSTSRGEELLATGDGTSWPTTGWNTNSRNVSCSTKLEKRKVWQWENVDFIQHIKKSSVVCWVAVWCLSEPLFWRIPQEGKLLNRYTNI
jgi:hypothetical protein